MPFGRDERVSSNELSPARWASTSYSLRLAIRGTPMAHRAVGSTPTTDRPLVTGRSCLADPSTPG